ncbi:MAG TPA: hypothetical protein VF185_00185 [Patescibacteria group bacterium]
MVKIAYKNPTGAEASLEVDPDEIKSFLAGSFSKIINHNKKNPRNKIGILIAVSSEDNDEKKHIDNDLISELNKFLNSKNLAGLFNIISLDTKEAKEIDNTNWQKAVSRHKAHLIVYGHISKRNVNGIKNYSLKLEAGIVHNPIPIILSDLLSSEFAGIFPRERYFPTNDDLLGFEITTEWMGLSLEYMIGVALYVSRNLGLAYTLFEELDKKLNNISKTKGIEAVKHLKVKVPQRTIEVSLSICDFLYTTYSRKRDKKFIVDTRKYLDTIIKYNPKEKRAKNFLAIYYFLIENNAKKAIVCLKDLKDPIQPYNMGFLLFFIDEIHQGLRHYNRAFKRRIPSKALIDAESFMEETLNDDPTKVQIKFAMGLINYRGKEDYTLALEDFKNFVKTSKNNNRYPELLRLSKIYIQEIIKKI